MLFRTIFGSAVDSNSKNFDGDTFRHFAREMIRSKEGCRSPRSILPRCFTSMSTLSATCQIFRFLDLRTERNKTPNCEAGVIGILNSDDNCVWLEEKPPYKSLLY